jgi:methylase of polypeptide subunit release factors
MKLLQAPIRAFMVFWYPYVRMLNVLSPSITIDGKQLVIAPEVYKPLENEHAVVGYCKKGERVLDLGCGCGVNAIFVAPVAREVVAVDISPAAVKNTQENLRRHGLKNVKVKKSDMFSNVDGQFDVILANPPYVAVTFDKADKQFATSERYLPTLFANAGKHLTKDGRLVVQFPIWVKGAVESMAAEHGFKLVSVKRTPLKSLGLFLISIAYMQVGFRSAFYVFRLDPKAAAKLAAAKAKKPAARAARRPALAAA